MPYAEVPYQKIAHHHSGALKSKMKAEREWVLCLSPAYGGSSVPWQVDAPLHPAFTLSTVYVSITWVQLSLLY